MTVGLIVLSILLGLKFTFGHLLDIRDGLMTEGSVSTCLFLLLSGVDFLEVSVNQGHKFNLSSLGINSLPRALTSANEVKQVGVQVMCSYSQVLNMYRYQANF